MPFYVRFDGSKIKCDSKAIPDKLTKKPNATKADGIYPMLQMTTLTGTENSVVTAAQEVIDPPSEVTFSIPHVTEAFDKMVTNMVNKSVPFILGVDYKLDPQDNRVIVKLVSGYVSPLIRSYTVDNGVAHLVIAPSGFIYNARDADGKHFVTRYGLITDRGTISDQIPQGKGGDLDKDFKSCESAVKAE